MRCEVRYVLIFFFESDLLNVSPGTFRESQCDAVCVYIDWLTRLKMLTQKRSSNSKHRANVNVRAVSFPCGLRMRVSFIFFSFHFERKGSSNCGTTNFLDC